jgi:hypothetical protein
MNQKKMYVISCLKLLLMKIQTLALLGPIFLYSVSGMAQVQCIDAPSVSTDSVVGISSSGATVHGRVSSDGGTRVRERGACYGTSTGPTIGTNRANSGSDTGSYTVSLSGLNASTVYYLRAYATNSVGTGYGNQVSFTTSSPVPSFSCGTSTVTDVDGNSYNTVQIGT